jgi:hypothetical protein
MAELTDGSQTEFTAGSGRGSFTAANGRYTAHTGGPALRARLSLKVRR